MNDSLFNRIIRLFFLAGNTYLLLSLKST